MLLLPLSSLSSTMTTTNNRVTTRRTILFFTIVETDWNRSLCCWCCSCFCCFMSICLACAIFFWYFCSCCCYSACLPLLLLLLLFLVSFESSDLVLTFWLIIFHLYLWVNEWVSVCWRCVIRFSRTNGAGVVIGVDFCFCAQAPHTQHCGVTCLYMCVCLCSVHDDSQHLFAYFCAQIFS